MGIVSSHIMGNNASAMLENMAGRVFMESGGNSENIEGDLDKPPLLTGILAFEAGAIMAKALYIWQGLQPKEISVIRNSLQAPGIISLISHDFRKLWALAGLEKQKELNDLASRISVLAIKSTDPNLHSLSSKMKELETIDADLGPLELNAKESETLLRFVKVQANLCNVLKLEMEALQSLEKRVRAIRWESDPEELLAQRETVRRLQGTSIWSQDLDTLVRLLVLLVCMIRKKVYAVFGQPRSDDAFILNSLGACGMFLHYAHIIVLIERIIKHPTMVHGTVRDDLYRMLPADVRTAVRVRVRQDVRPRLSDGVEANMMRSMSLLPPLAHNTLSWHHEHTPGNTYARKTGVSLVQTLYYAHKPTVNAALLDILVGLCCICLTDHSPPVQVGNLLPPGTIRSDCISPAPGAISDRQSDLQPAAFEGVPPGISSFGSLGSQNSEASKSAADLGAAAAQVETAEGDLDAEAPDQEDPTEEELDRLDGVPVTALPEPKVFPGDSDRDQGLPVNSAHADVASNADLAELHITLSTGPALIPLSSPCGSDLSPFSELANSLPANGSMDPGKVERAGEGIVPSSQAGGG